MLFRRKTTSLKFITFKRDRKNIKPVPGPLLSLKQQPKVIARVRHWARDRSDSTASAAWNWGCHRASSLLPTIKIITAVLFLWYCSSCSLIFTVYKGGNTVLPIGVSETVRFGVGPFRCRIRSRLYISAPAPLKNAGSAYNYMVHTGTQFHANAIWKMHYKKTIIMQSPISQQRSSEQNYSRKNKPASKNCYF